MCVLGKGGGLNWFNVYTALALGSAAVYKHTSYSVPMNDFQLTNALKRTYKSRLDTEMKQDEYSTARPALKRWSNRNTTVEPGGPDQILIIMPQQT